MVEAMLYLLSPCPVRRSGCQLPSWSYDFNKHQSHKVLAHITLFLHTNSSNPEKRCRQQQWCPPTKRKGSRVLTQHFSSWTLYRCFSHTYFLSIIHTPQNAFEAPQYQDWATTNFLISMWPAQPACVAVVLHLTDDRHTILADQTAKLVCILKLNWME